ncbi:MAG: CoA transferase, partial [Acidimicrobiia bacterium]
MIYQDLRVVDLTRGIAGAYCAKLLTDLGADVVFAEPVEGPLFTYLRTSQRQATDAIRWIEAADLALVGEPGTVAAGEPLVTVSITPVGHGGPDDGLELTEEVLQARCGSLSAHGHADRTPLTVGGCVGEYVTGAFAALGALTAWRRASRTGMAEQVDVSMLEAMQLTFVTVPTLMSRFPGGRLGTQRWVMIPGNEPTADDRYVGITTVTTAQWHALCRTMGRDDLVDDDELTTMLGRGRRAGEVNDILQAWTRAHTAAEVVEQCAAARVPAAVVGNGAELPAVEQLAGRDVFVHQPGAHWIRPRAPYRFHGVADRELTEIEPAHDPWSVRAA